MTPKTIIDPREVRAMFDYRDGTLYRTDSPGRNTPAGTRFGCTDANGYRRGSIQRRAYLEQRVVWAWHYGVWPRHEIDHIDGNPGNNRIENLRDVPKSTNQQNRHGARVDSRTGVVGVMPRRGGKFGAKARLGGECVWLGTFDTVEEAEAVRLAFVRANYEGNTL
ncbi:MAG: hypothetical protein RL260_2712 [Pseudomonadota bacterium]|jgi:hypothetical protein